MWMIAFLDHAEFSVLVLIVGLQNSLSCTVLTQQANMVSPRYNCQLSIIH
jgi:hypothetical protein